MTILWEQTLTGAQEQNDYNTDLAQNFESGLSAVVGQDVQAVSFNLKKNNSPTMTIQAKIWSNSSNPVVLATSVETVNASDLTTSFETHRFTFTSPVTMAADYKIGLAFSSANASNYVRMEMSTTDVDDTDTERTSTSTGQWEAMRTTSFTMSVEGEIASSATLLPPPPAFVRI